MCFLFVTTQKGIILSGTILLSPAVLTIIPLELLSALNKEQLMMIMTMIIIIMIIIIMVGLANNIIGLIKQNMNKWETNLYADGKLLGSVPIRR